MNDLLNKNPQQQLGAAMQIPLNVFSPATSDSVKTMTSREIADLVESRHDC
jgi:phage regulator Rha-like protein